MSWETVTKSKDNGGLGLCNLELMNEAFLAKLGWRLLHEEDSLWSQVLKSKYNICTSDCTTWRSRPNSSNVWKGILKAVPLLQKGLVKMIRNGKQTSFWHDCWLGACPLHELATRTVSYTEIRKFINDYWTE